jgi:hypothetical protein
MAAFITTAVRTSDPTQILSYVRESCLILIPIRPYVVVQGKRSLIYMRVLRQMTQADAIRI